MPRTYIKKRPECNYNVNDVSQAVHDVTNKLKTFREAEAAYGVSKSVIYHRINGRKVPLGKLGAGRPQALSPHIEFLTPRNLVELFCKTVENGTKSTAPPPPPIKKVNPRLQQLHYGEMLTAEDVLSRLREAEEKKKEKKKGKANKNKKRKMEDQSDDSEVEEQLPVLDDDELEDIVFGEEEDEQDQVEYSAPTKDMIKVGAYVLVRVLSGKKKSINYTYAAVVQEAGVQDIMVMGLKSVDQLKKIFVVQQDDIFHVDESDILAILPEPTLQNCGDRMKFIFEHSVEVREG